MNRSEFLKGKSNRGKYLIDLDEPLVIDFEGGVELYYGALITCPDKGIIELMFQPCHMILHGSLEMFTKIIQQVPGAELVEEDKELVLYFPSETLHQVAENYRSKI